MLRVSMIPASVLVVNGKTLVVLLILDGNQFLQVLLRLGFLRLIEKIICIVFQLILFVIFLKI